MTTVEQQEVPRTIARAFTRHLKAVGSAPGIPAESQHVVMRTEGMRTVSGIRIWPAEEWMSRNAHRVAARRGGGS